jgi:hypothetical protein
MKEYLVHAFMLPMSAQEVSTKISQSAFSTTSTSGLPNSATALMRLRSFSQITESGSEEPRESALYQLQMP